MSHRLTRKQFRDAAIIERWGGYDDEVFRRMGVSRETLATMQLQLEGRIVLPGDPDYNQARVLSNAAFDVFPAMIVYCAIENDVRISLNLAWANNMVFTVRSGGHCTAGFCGGPGMLLDVSLLNDATIDVNNQIAFVGAGCSFAKLNATLDAFQLHVPGGECPEVCIGGYLQGGGQGFTSRTFGMHCDCVRELRVMLYDGSIATANGGQNTDLYWAMRGGTGGNFGVLLRATLKLFPLVSLLYGWAVRWPLAAETQRDAAAQALMTIQSQLMRTAPPAMNPQVMICFQSDQPDGSDRAPWMLVRGIYVGPKEEGWPLVKPLLGLDGCEFQYDAVDSYLVLNTMLLETPHPIPQLKPGVWPPEDKQARYVSRDLTRQEWRNLLEFFVTETPNPWSYMCLEIYGGAINDYPIDLNAFIHRGSAFSAFLDVFWYDESEHPAAELFLTKWCNVMSAFWNGEIYQNYPSLAVPDYRKSYWGKALPALVATKQKYDPHGLFNFAQMVSPEPKAPLGQEIWPPAVAAALQQPIVTDPGGSLPASGRAGGAARNAAA